MPRTSRFKSSLRCALLACAGLLPLSAAHAAGTLTIATVNNGDMVIMQKLSSEFEKQHPDIHLKWVVLEENVLRQRVTTDIATKAGQFDVLTIGNYEVPLWAKQKWLAPVKPDAAYDVDDLLPTVRKDLTVDGALYALPFYAESDMTYYRKDLFTKAGITMPAHPTYAQLAEYADKITDKTNQVYGICLRGKPGWGENMAFLTATVHAFGGQWFDASWKPTLDTPEWKAALTWYVDVMKKDGPPGAASNGFNENLALFASGHCGIWVDSTVAGGLLFDPKQSQVADKVGFTAAPSGTFANAPSWLWIWSLAIPASSKNVDDATTFITWATSKAYVDLVAKSNGWVAAPAGTRNSTYANPDYQKAAPFAGFVRDAIEHSNPDGQTKAPRAYTGAQFADIPQFQAIGTQVGQSVAALLTTSQTVDSMLSSSDRAVTRVMRQSGLLH
ncbi:sugar ABC transporter substrate-binding protein [Ameyamaea chiangmaiensis]|uniref:Sugar ABC transporter substrate-binding protein n=1 Tax=Ameyamaea chiangmaiensis TaxID=442969 RepID=A0A850PC65_9PROT|nr:sugar ABC transporter substrate-binding protein [Ameyamaea chiangmaiensis]MBS4075686.1 sugar ABC transporter substrate-binding protein [Ameyamaea chiangmaiensis]NVN40259.1 sugar ABC transporter substrate-binding protein [Ameyamaea chiangmaiensis]